MVVVVIIIVVYPLVPVLVVSVVPEIEVRAVLDNVVALVVPGSTTHKYCHTAPTRFKEMLMFVVHFSISFSHLTK